MAVPVWNENSKHYKVDTQPNPKDRIEVEVGDSKDPSDFHPQMKLMRWDNEANVSFRLDHGFIPGTKVTRNDEEGTITWTKKIANKEWVAKFYEDWGTPEGAYKFVELILPERPPVDSISFTTQSKDVAFYYQPPLTQEEIDEGANRPDEVVGSYAIYSTKRGGMNWKYGKEYKVGKIGHLYRPKIIDANGDETWGEYNTDLNDTGILTLSIDPTWLDNAVYPVVVDPAFGYTALGASNAADTISGAQRASALNNHPGESGTTTKISVGSQNTDTVDDAAVTVGLYDSSGNLIASGDEVVIPANTSSSAFFDANISTSVSAQDYWVARTLSANGSPGYRYVYDTGGSSGDSKFGGGTETYPTLIDPWSPSNSSSRYSIYATYTESTASNETLIIWSAQDAVLPSSAYAEHSIRNYHPTLNFDASTDESAVFEGVLPRTYGSGGIRVNVHFSMASATSGFVVLDVAFERIGDQQLDIDSDSFATAKSVTMEVSATSGNVVIAPLTFTNGAEMDSVAAGEAFRVKVTRDANNGSDTAAGDMELLGIELREI